MNKRRFIFLLGILIIAIVIVQFSGLVKPNAATSNVANSLLVPSINLITPIVYLNTSDDEAVTEATYRGAVHKKGTALPGEDGESHVYVRRLPELSVGDEILIQKDQNQALSFRVIDIKIGDMSYESSTSTNKPTLTLHSWYSETGNRMQYLVVAELN